MALYLRESPLYLGAKQHDLSACVQMLYALQTFKKTCKKTTHHPVCVWQRFGGMGRRQPMVAQSRSTVPQASRQPISVPLRILRTETVLSRFPFTISHRAGWSPFT